MAVTAQGGVVFPDSGDQPAQTVGAEEFLWRVAERIGARRALQNWDASAVLSTLAEAVSGGQLNQLLSQLPSG